MRDGKLRWPMILTRPGVVTTSPGLEPSTLPPASTARSTTIEPGASSPTISSVSRTGAFLPGISAAQHLGNLLPLPALVVLAHLAGVAAGGLRGLRSLLVDRDEGGAEALDLF